jgi:hypothetical protein
MKIALLIALSIGLSACATVPAQKIATVPATSAPSSIAAPFDLRANQLLDLLRGTISAENYFDDTFLTAVPAEKFKAITKSIITEYGKPIKIVSVDRKSPESGIITVQFEKAVAAVKLNISNVGVQKVNGLLFAKFDVADDSFAKIDADFAALPGKSGYVVEKLNDNGRNQLVAARNAGEQFAIGSTFKLYILAELASQISAGERQWGDVIPLSNRSFSSTATSKWPKDSPATLQTLALQMISVSDNSASDTLLKALGRSSVERKLALIGHSAPDKTLPFLSTVEAFALKSPANAELRKRYLNANEAQQRDLLEREQARLGFDQVDDRAFASGPAFIDSLEWFASPYNISELLDHIRKSRSDRMMQILSVNTGISQSVAEEWNYVGYKGGSEPGVISMSLLLQSKSGQWYAVSGSWNDPAKEVDETKFVSLMTRLVQAAE